MGHTVFLLAAGFGSRLRPLTNHRPKPLLPLLGQPMLNYALHWLRSHGHSSFIVNGHHLWQHVARWSETNNVSLQVERPDILGTGGGLKAARPTLAERFLIWNGDIVSDIDPTALLQACPADGAAMALLYQNDLGTTTRIIHDPTGRVQRIGNICATADAPQPSDEPGGIQFSGIHAMSRAALDHIPDGFQCVVRTAYNALVPADKVQSIQHEGMWFDTGKPHEYLKANLRALRGEITLSFDPWTEANPKYSDSWIHKSTAGRGSIHNSVIGKDARLSPNIKLDSCVVWDGATVPNGEYKHCIFHDGGILQVESSLLS